MGQHNQADDFAHPSRNEFILTHLLCLAVFWSGVTAQALALGVALYLLRILAISAGYHRYFAHRSFQTSRIFQFLLGFLAQTSAQRGVLWWAARHRRHHKHSDTVLDVHSPILRGFLYAHAGWIFVPCNSGTNHETVRDLACYPELRWLDRHPFLPSTLLAFIVWIIAGWPGLVVGFCWSTVAVWHATFSINSLAHLVGRRRYITGDQSRNNWFLALLTLGEGWHNNHHAYQVSARLGFRWWEYDPTFYMLKALSYVGLIWDLHVPPRALVEGEQRLGRNVIEKAAAQLAGSYPIETIANHVLVALAPSPSWVELRARVLSAHVQVEAFWAQIHLSELPTLDDVRGYARANLPPTSSLDEIAACARRRLLELVYAQLVVQIASTPG